MNILLVALTLSVLVSEQEACLIFRKKCVADADCCGSLKCLHLIGNTTSCRPEIRTTPPVIKPNAGQTTKTPANEAKSDRRWPNGVVYYKTDKYFEGMPRSPLKAIRKAMDDIRRLTNNCVTFVNQTTEPDYVFISFSNNECSSTVGYRGGKQDVSLAFDCLSNNGGIQHELMHTLGFYHEHTRIDRDNYIAVNWNNIESGQESEFEKKNFFLFGLPYDFESVLHYATDYFGKKVGNQKLIRLKPASKTDLGTKLGNLEQLSPLDVKKIKMHYGCRA